MVSNPSSLDDNEARLRPGFIAINSLSAQPKCALNPVTLLAVWRYRNKKEQKREKADVRALGA